MSDGTDGSFLAQNQTLMLFSFLSMTYLQMVNLEVKKEMAFHGTHQPPPTELKEGP